MSRSRAAMQAWVSSLTFIVVTMITGFVITPWVLGRIGQTRFGFARTLTEASGYISLVAQGITVAMVPLLASARGRDDRDSMYRTLAVGFRIYFLAAFLFLIVGLSLVPVLGRVLHAAPAVQPELRIAWLICLAGVALTVLSPMKTLVEIAHKGYVSNALMGTQFLVAAVLTVGFVWAGLGIVGLILATILASLFYNVSVTAVALRLNPGLISATREARPTRADWKAVAALSFPTLLTMLSERIGVLSDSIVLAIILNAAAATKLAMTQRLSSLGQLMLNGVSGAIWPSLAEMHTRGEHRAFNVRLIELTRLVVVMGIAGLAPVIAYNPLFIARWVGPALDGGRLVVVVASAIAILQGLLQVYSATLVSTGFVGRLALSAMVSAILNLSLSVFLTFRLGLIGPILGTLSAVVAVQLWYLPLQLRRSFGTPIRGLVRAAGVPIAFGIPYTLGLIALADSHTPPNWFALLGEMAISAIVFLVFAFNVILGPGDRDLWRARLLAPLLRRWRRNAPAPVPGPTLDDFTGPGSDPPLGP